jgi:hypothetical protein
MTRVLLGIATDFIQYPTTYIIFDFSSEKDADVRQSGVTCVVPQVERVDE